MREGTTQSYTFEIDLPTSEIEKAKVSFEQDGNIIIEKREDDLGFYENCIGVVLSQEETFLFDKEKVFHIQLRVKTKDGAVLSTDEFVRSIYPCLDREVL